MKPREYRAALKVAQKELLELHEQREDLDRRIARTRQTVQTLFMQLSTSEGNVKGPWDVIADNLTESVRWVLSAATRPLSAPDIRDQVIRLGFEITSSNPLASVHGVLNRLIEQGEAHPIVKLHPDGEMKIFTRSYWWGEYGELPSGWVLETDDKSDQLLKNGTKRVIEGMTKARARALRQILKRSAETERKTKGKK